MALEEKETLQKQQQREKKKAPTEYAAKWQNGRICASEWVSVCTQFSLGVQPWTSIPNIII